MATTGQLWLPRLRGVKKGKRVKQPPQPRVGEFRIIKQYEIFHRPFDLRFRGRINRWLKKVQQESKFKFKDALEEDQLKIVRLYFSPQSSDKRWLNQDEVLLKIKGRSKKKLRISLVSALIRIWKRDKAEQL